MHDLHWIMPITTWSSTDAAAPKLDFVDPMVRRRLSTLSKMALAVAQDCVRARPEVRLVFASRHGELSRTTEILRDIASNQAVSPNAFSLSVMNAMPGIFSIARGDRAAATAVSCGPETLGYAMLEAYALYATDPSTPVLLVYSDEPADGVFGHVDHEVARGALAILLDATQQPIGNLSCIVNHPAPLTAASTSTHERSCATQSDAVQACLDQRSTSVWHGPNATWQWEWNDIAA